MANQALAIGSPRFKIRPKYHSFACEIVDRIRGGNAINPQYLSCNGEEDLIGKLCSMLKKSLHPSTYGQRALERAMLGLNVHLMALREKEKALMSAFCVLPLEPLSLGVVRFCVYIRWQG